MKNKCVSNENWKKAHRNFYSKKTESTAWKIDRDRERWVEKENKLWIKSEYFNLVLFSLRHSFLCVHRAFFLRSSSSTSFFCVLWLFSIFILILSCVYSIFQLAFNRYIVDSHFVSAATPFVFFFFFAFFYHYLPSYGFFYSVSLSLFALNFAVTSHAHICASERVIWRR